MDEFAIKGRLHDLLAWDSGDIECYSDNLGGILGGSVATRGVVPVLALDHATGKYMSGGEFCDYVLSLLKKDSQVADDLLIIAGVFRKFFCNFKDNPVKG